MDSKSIDDKIQLWDSLTDETVVYVPTVYSKDSHTMALFVEAASPKNKESVVTMIFLNKDEADQYRTAKSTTPITFVKISLGKLYSSFSKFFGKNYSKQFNCMLSTVDVKGEFHRIETVWSNQTNS